MAEIGQLPPAYRVPPSHPATGTGKDNPAPQRKPGKDDREQEQHRQRREDDGDASHIDEYA